MEASEPQPEEGMGTEPESGIDPTKVKDAAVSVARGSFLDKVRLASVLTVLTYLAAFYCLVTDKIKVESAQDFLMFFGGLAAMTAGNAALGKVRNDAKKGMHEDG